MPQWIGSIWGRSSNRVLAILRFTQGSGIRVPPRQRVRLYVRRLIPDAERVTLLPDRPSDQRTVNIHFGSAGRNMMLCVANYNSFMALADWLGWARP